MKKLIGLTLILSACADKYYLEDSSSVEALQQQVYTLQEEANALEALIQSDYATCPNSGDTSDALIRKICQVAQASTLEARVQLSAQMQAYVSNLVLQIDAINSDLVDLRTNVDAQAGQIVGLQGSVALIQASILTVQNNISTLQSQMTSVEAAITALQNLTNSISGSIAGALEALDVGVENLAAGPVYETVIRRLDKTRYNAYVEAYGAVKVLGNNAVTATNGSTSLSVSLTAHGYLVGDVVQVTGLTSGRGLSAGRLTGEFSVVSATANSFVIVAPVSATSNGTLGGSNGSVRQVIGRGMSTVWKSGNVSDSAVRLATLGTKRYNFIIRRRASDVTNNTAELCYHNSTPLATFATLNAAPEGGAGVVICK